MQNVANYTNNPKAAAITLEHVWLGWRDRIALRDITGQFNSGSLTAIVGPNGAGKSTLVKGIMGVISPMRGKILLPNRQASDIAYLPQATELDRSFPISVYDLVAMGAWHRVGAWRQFPLREHQRIRKALKAVGLADFGPRIIGTLSGGQLQRALFARLLMQEADVFVLDEPFSAVDAATIQDLLGILQLWHQAGKTVIAVLHDFETVRQHFPQTLLLGGQVVAWGETESVLTPENLHMAQHLCAGDYL
ncbi:MAG TPA: metal ABC transporter ATP-binding protein [Burkholderiaceae bacterium]|nr:metal ABC transporter ATP-binding protein [Burkholderiaceae bacterium]